MISLRNLSLYRGSQPLLQGVDLTVHAGQKLGVVGPNGSGKSSLFAMLRGELAPDAGDLDMPTDLVIAHVAQETPALERSALDYVIDGDQELRALERELAAAEAAGDGRRIAELHAQLDGIQGYTAPVRAAELLHGLGFANDDQQRPVKSFSGGWRMRLNLAQALMRRSDLLLLDEPTNHLDLEAVLWLEQWLKRYPGTLLLISHDRDFLDACVDGIIHLHDRKLVLYRGNYSAFERQRAERLAQQQAQYEKQQREIAHLTRFIERFRAKATKARAAQSRLKALERMERIAPAHVDSPFRFEFAEPPRAPDPIVTLDQVELGYDGAPVLQGLDLSIRPGMRIGLLGPNGAGKSTLVRCLAGALAPRSGQRLLGQGTVIGYFEQHQLEQLDLAASPLLHLQRLAPEVDVQRLRDFLGGFGFSGDQALAPVGPFSGGEKARLVLALIVWQRPNLLLLDEPTNHLDLEMRHALTVALQSYQGAMVLVSHDRHLLTTTTDEFWLVADGQLRPFDGDLGDYQAWVASRNKAAEPVQPAAARGEHTAQARREARRREAERREAARPLQQRVRQLDRELEELAARLAALERELADPAVYEPGRKTRLAELLQAQGELRKRQESLEEQWLEAQEQLEALLAQS
ncbi:MAG: ATP-binding cassette domain-containing protein [Xanthomonadaceae bacterium]|nr:ATP-binding cassette domain-containing protein [Xanthomonadaceae bacterium]